ncbi:transcriptional regulator [Enterobacterales bacterium]|nr:transcriptional regulator [Enterobacterales bacterium]
MKKRDIFGELVDGMHAWSEANQGKRTLKTEALALNPEAGLSPEQLRQIRENLNLSQAVFAHYLQTALTTYQNWEQGRAKPNKQAILLIKLVEKDPVTLEQLAKLL